MIKRWLAKILNVFNQRKKLGKEEYFQGISDMLYFGIRSKNDRIVNQIADFMSREFRRLRAKAGDGEVVYPFSYYKMNSRTVEELAINNTPRFRYLVRLSAGSEWLLGEIGMFRISESTYSWIWNNILLSLEYKRDDFIMSHWEYAHQFSSYSFDVNSGMVFKRVSVDEEDELLQRKRRFKRFHYVLGGMCLYAGKFDLIKRIFSYTQSIPARYELLPDSMDEIVDLFVYFSSPVNVDVVEFSTIYHFPNLTGLNSEDVVRDWVCQYIVVLFLRQYTLVYYLYRDPLVLSYNQSQVEKARIIKAIDMMVDMLRELQTNRELMSSLGLDFITEKWCAENQKLAPEELLMKFKSDLVEMHEEYEVNQHIADVRRLEYLNYTKRSIESVISDYSVLMQNKEFRDDVGKIWHIRGYAAVFDKNAFVLEGDATHLNFHSFVADAFVEKFRNSISESFYSVAKRRYLFGPKEFVESLKRLNLSSERHLLVDFGVELNRILDTPEGAWIRDFEILRFGYRNFRLVGDSVFVIRKKDLPKLFFLELAPELIAKYESVDVLKGGRVYVSLVDLNSNEVLRDEVRNNYVGKDLRKSVYAGILIDAIIVWPDVLKCIQVQRSNPFIESGIINSLDDVLPFEE